MLLVSRGVDDLDSSAQRDSRMTTASGDEAEAGDGLRPIQKKAACVAEENVNGHGRKGERAYATLQGKRKGKERVKKSVSLSLEANSDSEGESATTESVASMSRLRETEKARVQAARDTAGDTGNHRRHLDVQLSPTTGTSFTYTSGEESD